MVQNKQVLFKAEPEGLPRAGQSTELVTSEIDLDTPLNGGVVTKTICFSMDPTMRNRMKQGIKYYTTLYEPGKPIEGYGIAEVQRSDNDAWKQGDLVRANNIKLEQWSIRSAEDIKLWKKLPIQPELKLSITQYIGAAGMPGMTAYMGLKEVIGDFKPGSSMFVSAAAGAVGQLVCQIAKRSGVRVIASAGSDEKIKYLLDVLKCDTAFNYKTADVNAELQKFGGDSGITYYFDNVGGQQLEAYIANAARHGIIVACGYVSAYNAKAPYSPSNLFDIVVKELTYRGFISSSLVPKYFDEFLHTFPKWIADGTIKAREDVAHGIERAEDAFTRLFTGDAQGKVAVLLDTERANQWNL